MTNYTLHYFDFMGRAENARYVLAAAGVSYVDHREPDYENWKAKKSPQREDAPIGQLPYLDVNGVKITQSMTVSRYLAKEFGLYGKDNLEQAKIDAIVDTCMDLLNYYYSKRFYAERPAEAWTQFVEEDLKKHLGNIEKLVTLYGSNGYSVGSSLSWSDLTIFDTVSQILKTELEMLEHFPRTKQAYNSAANHPNILNYVKNRKPQPY